MNNDQVMIDIDSLDIAGEGNFSEDQQSAPAREWMKKLPDLLRGLGALAVLISLYNFFALGWEGSSDLLRYLMLLGHTGALAGIGLASGHFLREGKGARLLLSLALVSVVANFAILGAFIFSSLPGSHLAAYPNYLTWSVGNPSIAIITTVGSLLVLLPVVRIGFLTLARGISKRMTLIFLLANAALLLPIRTPIMIAVLTLVMAGMLLLWCGGDLRKSTEVKTREGMVALLMQFMPIGVLLGRNIWLYSSDSMLYTVAVSAGYIAIRQFSLFFDERSGLRDASNALSLLLTAMTGFGLYAALLEGGAGDSLALVAATLAIAGMNFDIANRAGINGVFYRSLAIVVTVFGLGINLLFFGGILPALLTMAMGVVLIAGSYVMQMRSSFMGGVVLVLGSLLEQGIHAFRYFDLGSWVGLAMLGIVAIVIGSLLESSGGQLKARFQVLKSHYSEWSY